jgi:hypothetical protein
MSADMTQQEADRLIEAWSRGKRHFPKLRGLMGALAHSEIIANAHGHKTGMGFIKGPNEWDLDKLHAAARLLHPETQAEAVAELHRKGRPQPESARESAMRAVGKPVPDKPGKPESVRESIERARQQAGRK